MHIQQLQDSEILSELRNYDINNPVEKLYKLYFNAVVQLIEASGGNKDDGADIFQEAILVFVDKVKTNQFREESSVKTYLFAVSRNLWKEELRSRKRRTKREHLSKDDDIVAMPETDQRYFNKDIQEALNSVFRNIGEVCQRILKGFYYEDLSMKELLKEFNYENEQVLRNRKSICMKKIKDLLQKDNYLYTNFKNLTNYGR